MGKHEKKEKYRVVFQSYSYTYKLSYLILLFVVFRVSEWPPLTMDVPDWEQRQLPSVMIYISHQ